MFHGKRYASPFPRFSIDTFARNDTVALKSEFDTKSYRIVLFRSVVGALIGSVPGIAYIFQDGNNLGSNPFGMMLLQTGSMIGALVMGLGAVAGTIVAALKNRGTGPKTNRIKEYLNPETLPAIPPSTRETRTDTGSSQDKTIKKSQPSHQDTTPSEARSVPITQLPDEPVFEDYDR